MGGHAKQELVWNSEARFIDCLAGRRSGKTYGCERKGVKNVYRDLARGKGRKFASIKQRLPRLHYWYVAPDYSLTKIMRNELFSFLAENNALDLIQLDLTLSKNQLWLYPEILIEFKSADNPQKLVGVGLDGLRITETARLKPNVWNDNLRPTLADKQGWGIFDTTPLGYNWYASEIREPALTDPEWECFHWNTVENTMVPGLIDEVNRAKLTMPDKYFKRNYEASLDAFFGQVYDEFNKNIHVQEFDFDVEQYYSVRAGVDWGYAHNGAIIVCGFRYDGGVDVLAEACKDRVLVHSDNSDCWTRIATNLMKKYNINVFNAGVDQPESITLFNINGLPTIKAHNSVALGIQTVATLLHIDGNKRSLLRIHPSCKTLIKEFASYKWKARKDGIDSEDVVKENDDALDSLRYCLYSNKHLLKNLTIIDKDTTLNTDESI